MHVVLYDDGVYESTEPVEAAHLAEAFAHVIAIEEPFEGDDALALLQWQQEVVVAKKVNWVELGEVQLLE